MFKRIFSFLGAGIIAGALFLSASVIPAGALFQKLTTIQPTNVCDPTTPTNCAPVSSTTGITIDSELPASATLADATSNPTTTGVASYNMCFNGTTWDRCPISTGGSGTVNSNTARVVLATDVALPTGTNSIGTVQPGNTANTTPWLIRQHDGTNASLVDPCASVDKITDPFSLTARGVVIAATSAKKNYICSIVVVAGAAEVFNLVEGTGTTCQTSTAAIVGSTTAANGLSFAANGGFSSTGGSSTVIAGKTANVDTCIVPSGSNRLSGFITYVQR